MDSTSLFHANFNNTVAAMALPVAISNTWSSIQMVSRNKPFIYKINLAQSLFLLVNAIIQMLGGLGALFNCDARNYTYGACSYFSIVLIDMVLFMKAYYTNRSNLYIIASMVVLRLVHMSCWVMILLNTTIVNGLYESCQNTSKELWFVGLLSTEAVIIAFLTVSFLITLYRTHQFSPAYFYSSLMRDGVIFAVSRCLIYFIITILYLLHVAPYTELLFVEWTIASKLMTEQLLHSHEWRHNTTTGISNSNQPPTVSALISPKSNIEEEYYPLEHELNTIYPSQSRLG
ncbi:hypothetical protein K493DRAFT_311260 [Basidiobolus meristosporus CBS 931.73]|uniref:Uncharacterized protein n=1 Tax=Basidiobolus meristosporus CBS 931.73 TaxID=1314790 RepID=A0A1Y1Z358_9FUNG|nr:hypothetical protein K493DRAFT_311260 [Basidiobolus meristosporus CBS 931.73]|eukprot:ORY04718.1 hypothetical protein K493DRAFT_311260 [Basidiobolus meristosporus CBS 931.73]